MVKPIILFVILLLAISFFSLQVKRCHDIGWTGWLALLSFVPVVHWFWWCLLGIMTGNARTEFKKAISKLKDSIRKENEEREAKEEAENERIIAVRRHLMNNFEKYSEYTKARNWDAICRLNCVELDSLGTKKELNVLANYLEDDEVVFALTSGVMTQTKTSNTFDFGLNTWLVALTSERFLFLDCAMMTKSTDTQSIRHDKVQAVSASQGLVLGKIMIDLGSRMVVIDNCNKSTVPVIASLANKWLKELQKQKSTIVSNGADTVKESPLDQLEKLSKLLAIGALTDEEFKTAKAKILATELSCLTSIKSDQ